MASNTPQCHAAATRIRASWLASCQRVRWRQRRAERARDRAAETIRQAVRLLQVKRMEAIGDFFTVCKVFRAEEGLVVRVQAFVRALYSQQLREILRGLRAKGFVWEACQKMQPTLKTRRPEDPLGRRPDLAEPAGRRCMETSALAIQSSACDHSERCHMAVLRYKMEDMPRRDEASGPHVHFKSSAASCKHTQRSAATKIQAFWRAKLVQDRLRPLRETQAKEKAALQIQRALRFMQATRFSAVGRCFLARLQRDAEGGDKAAAASPARGGQQLGWLEPPQIASEHQDAAAVRIQSVWRRFRVRHEQRPCFAALQRHRAAATLQWVYRWLQGCRMQAIGQQFCLLYEQKRPEDKSAPRQPPESIPPVVQRPEHRGQSACRIQTAWRGFHTRLQLRSSLAEFRRNGSAGVLQSAYRFLQAVRMQEIGQYFCRLCMQRPTKPRQPKGNRALSSSVQPSRPAWGPITAHGTARRPAPLVDGVKFDGFAQSYTAVERRQSPLLDPGLNLAPNLSARLDEPTSALPELSKRPRPWKPKFFDLERHKRLEQEVRHLEEELAKFRFRERLRLQTASRITPRQMVLGDPTKKGNKAVKEAAGGWTKIDPIRRLDDITGQRKLMDPTGLTPITRSPHMPPAGQPLIASRLSQAFGESLLQLLPDADGSRPERKLEDERRQRASMEGQPMRVLTGSGAGSPSSHGSPKVQSPQTLNSPDHAFLRGSPVVRSPMSLSPLAPSDIGVASPHSGHVQAQRRSETYDRRLPSLDAAVEFGPLLNNVHVRTGLPSSPEARKGSRTLDRVKAAGNNAGAMP